MADPAPSQTAQLGPQPVPGLTPPAPNPPQAPAGPLSGVSQALSSRGVTVHALFLDQFLANPSSGLHPGHTSNTGALIPSADFDLQRLAGLPGATVHFEENIFMFKSNTGMLSDIGSILGGLPFKHMYKSNYLSVLTYEQTLFDDMLDIEVGRTNPLRAFDGPNCANLATCQDSVYTLLLDTPPPAYATWGGRVRVNLTPTVFVQAGAYEDDIYDFRGTTGWDWSTRRATGAQTLLEVGRQSSFAQERYPGRYELTVYDNTSTFKDPYDTARGRSDVFFNHDMPAFYDGSQGGFFRGSQVIWRPGSNEVLPARHLDLFGGAGVAFSQPLPQNFNVYAGLNYFLGLPARPFDHVGVKVQYLNLTTKELEFQRDARIAAHGPDELGSPNEYRFEVNGHFSITPTIALEPSVQYYVNPDSFFAPLTGRMPRDGFQTTLTAVIYLGDMLGFPPPKPL